MRGFLTPGMLMVIVPAVVVVLLVAVRSRAGLPWRRLVPAILLRAAVALGLIVALARPAQMDERTEPRALIVLFDVSDSVPASAREMGAAHLAGVLHSVAAEPGLSVTLVPFAGAPAPLGTRPAAEAGLGERERAVLLWDTQGKALRRELDSLREQPGADAPAAAGGPRRAELERTIAGLDATLAALDRDRTDLGRALACASGIDPAAASRSVLLYTDGRWDATDDPAWGAAASAFARLQVVPLDARGEIDLVAEDLRLPARVRSGEPFDARVTLALDGPGRATVQLLIDGREVGEAPVVFSAAGRQEAVFADLVLEEGLHRVQAIARLTKGAETETRNDVLLGPVEVTHLPRGVVERTETRNDIQIGSVEATGRPRLALVEYAPGSGTNLARALEAQDFEVVRVPARDLPARGEALSDFDAVALAEPDAKSLTDAQADALAEYVADGGGLFVATGVDGKTLAGLRSSRLAKILPVRIPEPEPEAPEPDPEPPDPDPEPTPEKKDPVPADVEVPTIALVLAIDKSGSMQGEKLLLAKEAVIASARALRPDDLVGVLAFDGQPRWAVTLRPARPVEYLEDRVSRLVAEGGTDIYPALVAAFRELSATDAKTKHVIVLTDGYTPMNDFQGLCERMVREGITISTVGVGVEFDGVLLANIGAKWGKGTYDFTSDLAEVPGIFLKETRRAAKLKAPGAGGEKPPDLDRPDRPAEQAPRVATGNDPGKKTTPGGDGTKPKEETAPTAGPVRVASAGPGPLVEGLDPERLPGLERFAATDLRKGAAAPLIADPTGKPVLAFGRHGLGKVLAWTSDFRERGAPAWVRWETLPRFLARALRFVGSVEAPAEVEVEYRQTPVAGGRGVALEWTYPVMAGGGEVPAVAFVSVVPDDGRGGPGGPSSIPVRRSGPASFLAEVPIPTAGKLVPVTVRHETSAGKVVEHRFGLARPYPEELRHRGHDPEGRRALEALLGAEAEAPGAPVVAAARSVRRYREQGPNLILFLTFFFFAETMIRKLRW